MKKLEWLDSMRGIAACWVLLSHTVLAMRDFAHTSSPQVLANGFLGVDFFFVLSGFIIAYSSQQLVATGRGWRDYAAARAIRIYVPYLPISIALLAMYTLLPSVSHGARAEISLLTTLTLLPSNAPPALSVAWTLVHEMLFYLLFSVFFVSRRALVILLALWTVAIVANWASGTALPRAAVYLLSPLNLCFVLGVGVAWLTRRGVSDRAGIALGFAGLLAIASQAVAMQPNRLLVAFGFAALVAASRCSGAASRSPGRVLLTLGAASYAIYLVHNPAVSFFIRVALGIGNIAVLFIVVSASALAVGLGYHFAYERWALRKVRAIARKRFLLPTAPA